MPMITLRAARISCGYSAKQIADLCSIKLSEYETFEKDSRLIPKNIAVKLKNILGISLDKIYIGKENECFQINRINEELKYSF